MEATLTFRVTCGKRTCASKPGQFCAAMLYNALNGKITCHFFGVLSEKEGWVQRHPDCLAGGKDMTAEEAVS